MKIELARHSGFCIGVKNAILKIINEINSSEEDIYVYGPLIHNPQTTEVLSKRGLKTLHTLEDIDNKHVAIRTHGIPDNEKKEINSRASRTINLTCPRVARVQSIINKYSTAGHFTIIIGDKNHAEVIGLKSYALSGVFIISEIQDISNLPEREKYILVAQTTLDRKFYNKIVSIIKKKYKDVIIVDTLCFSTQYRQEDIIGRIGKGVDTFIVVGGKNSANTNRLAQIGKRNKIKTFHIETEEEINDNDLSKSNYVLVTAGASTPGWIINNVLERLYNIKYKKRNIFINSIRKLLEFVVRSNLSSAVAAFYLSLFVQRYSGTIIDYNFSIIALFFIFSMYSINNYFEKDFLKSSNSYKYIIYERYGTSLLILSILLMILSLIISIKYNPLTIATVIFSYLFGFFYSTTPVKIIIKRLNLPFIKKIYNSRIITIFGWLIITVMLPLTVHNINLLYLMDIASLSIFIFSFIFLRHYLLDLSAYQGDLIFGRETLPVWCGIKNCNIISILLSSLTIIIFSLNTYFNNSLIFLVFLINSLYFLFILYRINNIDYLISLKYEFLIDLNYIAVIIFYYLSYT